MIESRNLAQAEQRPVAPEVAASIGYKGKDLPKIEGLCLRVPIREGFEVFCYDMSVPQAVTSEWGTEPSLSIMLLVEARGSTVIQAVGEAPFEHGFAGGMAYVMRATAKTAGRNAIEASTHFEGIDLRLSIPFLERTGLDRVFNGLDEQSPGCRHAGPGLWLGEVPLTLGLRSAVDDLVAAGRKSSGTDDLIVEARALQILHGISQALEHDAPELSASPRFKAVLGARLAMCANPERDWTISILAQHCGLNTRSFKQEFRQAFGCTPRLFLQRVRVEEGRRLLGQGLSVTAASLAVGYANPSHFAKLYKRCFGVSPRNRTG